MQSDIEIKKKKRDKKLGLKLDSMMLTKTIPPISMYELILKSSNSDMTNVYIYGYDKVYTVATCKLKYILCYDHTCWKMSQLID